jgi:hypothetical protein
MAIGRVRRTAAMTAATPMYRKMVERGRGVTSYPLEKRRALPIFGHTYAWTLASA